tara:strand:+ start:3143 stop:4153 length:1011 start_codon:yes stop_codon:yes gene_type:complete
MSTFKPFLTSDILVTPFEVNKSFSFKGNELTSSNVGIERYIGQNIPTTIFVSGSNSTGQSFYLNKKLVYDSVKQLYYSNYLKSPSGSIVSTSSLNLDGTINGHLSTPNYYNYLSSTIDINRSFPTESNSIIGVTSIPSNLFGEYIKPGSFKFISPSGSITDDTEGNLMLSSSALASYHVGNIIYEHGMTIINKSLFTSSSITGSGYGFVSYGTASYSGGTFINQDIFESFFNNNNITCSFTSNITLFESQYKCTIRPDEFNYTQNPTILTNNESYGIKIKNPGIVRDFATGSYFTPYTTTVGLYNNNKELIAIGKLAQPLDMSDTTDTTILINLDL